MKRILRWVAGLLLAYVMVGVLLYVVQRQIVFAPSHTRVLPQDAGLEKTVVVELADDAGEVLYNWYTPARGTQPTLLYFHGNGGAIHGRAYKIRQYADRGIGVFIVGYPGYGGSGGQPTEPTLVAAALRAYDHLTNTLGLRPRDIVIYGESLGSAVATQVAARREAQALVLAAPMYSIEQIAVDQYPFLPVRYLIKDKFRSHEVIQKVGMPLLVVHGARDGLIPIESGQALFNEAAEPKRFVTLPQARHNDLYNYPIVDAVVEFLFQTNLQTSDPADQAAD